MCSDGMIASHFATASSSAITTRSECCFFAIVVGVISKTYCRAVEVCHAHCHPASNHTLQSTFMSDGGMIRRTHHLTKTDDGQPSATSPPFFDDLHFEHFDKSANLDSWLTLLSKCSKWRLSKNRGLVADD
jgi:hypothetical protein